MILKLRQWFLTHHRKLPWRINRTPYTVWVSEMMLQQTQVSVVIPYFFRWIERFPDVHALSKATVDEVMKLWEGLGYYSRVKNLLKGAEYVCTHFNGKLPEYEDQLQKIPGLGPYTVGAIRAFAFKQKAIALDGNVMRVLSRFFAISEDIGKTATRKKLSELAVSLLPQDSPWEIAEALIELGALICKKKPECHICPLQKNCKAYAMDLTDQLPIKAKRVATIDLYREVSILIFQDEVLVRKVPPDEIMAGLYEFPYFENKVDRTLGLQTIYDSELPEIKHHFTHYRAHLKPTIYQVMKKQLVEGYQWILKEDLKQLPFSSGHRKIITFVLSPALAPALARIKKGWAGTAL